MPRRPQPEQLPQPGQSRIVLAGSLHAKGLSTGAIAHFTGRLSEEMQDWRARPLERNCAAAFIDAIMVKIFRCTIRQSGTHVLQMTDERPPREHPDELLFARQAELLQWPADTARHTR